MASLAPAFSRPWAIDQAMLRLLATPKTTATRPSRLRDIPPPLKKEKGYQRRGPRASLGKKHPGPAALIGACSGLRPAGVFVFLGRETRAGARSFAQNLAEENFVKVQITQELGRVSSSSAP